MEIMNNFNFQKKKDHKSPNLFGLLDETQFYFKSLDNSILVNGFPSSIQIQVNLFEFRMNITLDAYERKMNNNIYKKRDSKVSRNDAKLVNNTFNFFNYCSYKIFFKKRNIKNILI